MIINKQNFKIFKYLHHFLGKNKKIHKIFTSPIDYLEVFSIKAVL